MAGAEDALAAVTGGMRRPRVIQRESAGPIGGRRMAAGEGQPMKTVTVGVLGAGRIGRLHTENLFRMPGVRVKSIADPYADFGDWPPEGDRRPALDPSNWCSMTPRSRRY